jgi:hypothetical protein
MNKIIKIISIILVGTLLLCACSKNSNNEQSDTTSTLTVDDIIDESDMFSKRDLDYSYEDRNPVSITLKDGKSSSDSENVTITDDTITITSEGVYILTGSLTDGQVIIDTDDSDKVQLVLDSVKINCDDSASIYAKSADKLFITSITDDNELTNKSDYVQIDDNNINAVVYSKCDLTLNGSGKLNVTAKYGHAVSSKDDLKITSGEYTITSSEKHSLDANDSIRITDCTLNLTAKEDAIHADNDEKEEKGFVFIKDGTITINADDDAIHSSSALKINDGTINIEKSYEGLEGRLIDISGGDITITSSDDGMNASSGSGSDMQFGGQDNNFNPNSDDTKDSTIESTEDTIDNTDDKDTKGGFGGQGGFGSSDTNCSLNITGGKIYVNAEGDGLDSNGTMTISGGEITVFGASNDGDSAIDYETSAEISGGTLIAVGMSGMAESFEDTSSQCSILYDTSSQGNSGTEIKLTDSDGNTILSTTAVKKFDCVIFSSPDITSSGKYNVVIGSNTEEIKMSGTTYSNGKSGGIMSGKGGIFNKDSNDKKEMPSGEQPSGEQPSGEMPSGDKPDGEKPDDMPNDFSPNDSATTSA